MQAGFDLGVDIVRYENLKFEIIANTLGIVDFEVEATDELIEIVNNIRKEKGYTDNGTYYGFCMFYYPADKILNFTAYCEPECDTYDMPMTNEETLNILFRLFWEIRKQEWEYEWE